MRSLIFVPLFVAIGLSQPQNQPQQSERHINPDPQQKRADQKKSDGSAHSQDTPAPSQSYGVKDHSQGASPKNKSQRESEEVKILPSKPQPEAGVEEQLVRATWWLVGIGVLQGLILGSQAWFLSRHSIHIKHSVEQMRAAVTAYEKYVDIGRDDLALTRESNAITKEATELTRQALILSHRPKVVVRNVAIDNEDRIFRWRSVQGGRAESWGPEPVTGTLRFVNIGDSTAHVVAWQCQILVAVHLPTAHILPLLTKQLSKPIELKAGVYGTMPLPEWSPLSTDELTSLWHPHMAVRATVYIVGELVYKDEIGTVRNTWFCRKRGYDESAFTAVDNPDYETAD